MSFSEKVLVFENLDGLTTYIAPTQVDGVVTLSGSLKGGEFHAKKSNSKIASLSGSMLDKGTVKKSKHDISEALDSIGADINFIVSNHHINFTAHCLSNDLEKVILLLSEMLQEPRYDSDELTILKKRIIANLERSKEDTRKQANINFVSQLYPIAHPNARYNIDDTISMVDNISVEQLKDYHQKAYGLGTINIAAVGDVDPDSLNQLIINGFSPMAKQSISNEYNFPAPNKRVHKFIECIIKDKTSCDLFVGQSIDINDNHKDYYSLMMGIYILGGNFSARLMQTVRDEQGLTYGIGSGMAGCSYGISGHWYTWGTFSPDILDKGCDATVEQINSWFETGITEEELQAKKTTFKGAFQVSLDTTSGFVDKILTNAEKGRSIEYLDKYNERIDALDKQSINKAIHQYIDPKSLTTSVAGSLK
tara:strand:- start:506 stop:1771 length:1266 start_codon:yes stop_codon:yes gene_type:complete